MKVFEEYDNLKEKIDLMDLNTLKEKFNSFNDDEKINILIRWFGMIPLSEKMFDNPKGLIYFKEKLLNKMDGLKC